MTVVTEEDWVEIRRVIGSLVYPCAMFWHKSNTEASDLFDEMESIVRGSLDAYTPKRGAKITTYVYDIVNKRLDSWQRKQACRSKVFVSEKTEEIERQIENVPSVSRDEEMRLDSDAETREAIASLPPKPRQICEKFLELCETLDKDEPSLNEVRNKLGWNTREFYLRQMPIVEKLLGESLGLKSKKGWKNER
jgi:hypothetical protein